MISHSHAVVWLDHRSARLFSFNRDAADKLVVKHHDATPHIHHKAGTVGPGHTHEDKEYLHAVAEALAPASEILIVGPASTKLELKAFLDTHAPAISKRVVGVEALDHPTGPEIVAYARKYFVPVDRMAPQVL